MFKLPPDKCPWCGKVVNAASGVGSRSAPRPGDFSVCDRCGEVLRFGSDLKLARAPTNWRDVLDPDQVRSIELCRAILGLDPKGAR